MLTVCLFSACKGLGRGEVYVDLANALVDYNDLKVVLIAPAKALYLGRLNSRVQIQTYHSWNSRLNPFLRRELKQMFQSLKADIIHTHFGKATEIYKQIATSLPSVFLATKHNVRKGKAFESVPFVTAVSPRAAASIHRDEESVIQNAIQPTPKPRSRKPDGEFRLLSVGRLDPIKGYDRLINAMTQLPSHIHLRLLGDGEHRNKLEQLVNDASLNDRVEMPGFTENVAEEMANADLFVLSSHSEGNCVALIEALFYAPLAVSTPVGAAEEVLGPEFLVDGDDLGKDLLKIINDYDRYRNEFTAHRKKIAVTYQWDHVAGQYRDLYHRIAN
ncbi:glycosyltransferase [bacterium]|nr:glycosyltransferase [bacterium]